MTTAGAGSRAAAHRPLTATERRVWLLDEIAGGTTAYDTAVVLRLTGRLDRAALHAAVRELADRCAALRSRAVVVEGVPAAAPAAGAAGVEVHDLRGAPAEAVRQAVTVAATRPLDLAAGPLLRATLVRTAEESWRLVLHAHALAADAASRQPLLDLLAAGYRRALAGAAAARPGAASGPAGGAGPAVLPADAPPGRDVAAWWRAALAGGSPRGPLPADRPAPAEPSFAGGRVSRRLPSPVAERVRQLAAAEGTSTEAVYLAVFAGLLARYGWGPKVVVGVPYRDPSAAGTVARRTDDLPVAVEVSGSQALRQVVRTVRASLAGARKNALPLLELGSVLGPDTGRGALFDVGFRYERAPRAPRLPGLRVALEPTPPADVPLDLSLVVDEAATGGVRLSVEYTSVRFRPAGADRVAGHVLTLLTAGVERPDAPVGELPLLRPAERAEVLRWGRGGRPAAGPDTVVEWFTRVAREHGGAEAVRARDGALSYAQLAAAAARVAARLHAAGVRPGDRVAVCLDRSVLLPVALLGVLRCGAAYVPIDPGHPPARVRLVLADAAVTAAVISSALPGSALPLAPERVVRLPGDPAGWGGHEATAPPPPARPAGSDLAYVIYTSGSTGAPKGVMVEHRSLCALLRAMTVDPGLGPGETMLGVTTPAFDLSVPDLFLPLVSGARLVLAAPEQVTDASALARLVDESAPALMQATPATWRLLLEGGWAGRDGLRAVVGGEAVPAALAARLLERTAGVWSYYGPTEATVWCAALPVHGAPPGTLADPVPLGRPLPGAELYVVDGEDSLLPVGLVGELLIGGEGVARGYWRRPELTAQRFGSSPVARGRRVYRTGDLARWDTDGGLHFAGRADFQVKLRGFRIELGDVEAALRAVPGVCDAVAVRREDIPGDPQLVGYVSGAGLTPAAVRRAAAAKLPPHMVPALVVALPDLPRNPHGKVDRAALPPPRRAAAEASPAGPRTPVEEALAGLWKEVLGLDRVGIRDDFFADLGGHSLLALRLAARLPRVLPAELPVRRFFEETTIERQAVAVTQEIARGCGDPQLEALLAGLEGGAA